jgi:hypothetical protein
MTFGDNIYEKLFSVEISRAEREQYEVSLKYFRDIKNVTNQVNNRSFQHNRNILDGVVLSFQLDF